MKALLVSIILGAAAGQVSADKPSTEKPENAKALEWASKNWAHFLKANIKIGDTEKQVKRVMQEISKDWGRVHLGGTGHYELLFRIDDFLQVTVPCDRGGLVVADATVALQKGAWIKQPDGSITEVRR